MPDLKISQLSPLPQAQVAATDELAIVDASASETKKVGAQALVGAGISFLPNGSIPWLKVDGSALTLPAGSVTTAALAPNSVNTVHVVDGAITDTKISGPLSLSKLGSQSANVVLAGPATGASAAPTFRALTGADLPIGTTSARGALSVLTGGGLQVDAGGALSLTSVVTAGTSAVVTYNANGRITAGRALLSSDLPIATTTTLGSVSIGTGLSVTAGGLVATNLTAAEIPGLDASKIVSGQFASARIANGAITGLKLADYSVSYIQEATPPVAAGSHHIGALWFQESSAKLAMWNGNSWMAVGQGALSAENLRFCGTFNAATGLITAVTQFGTGEGLSNGVSIPTATNQLTGVYLVCDTPGTHDGKTYDAGDWILCMGQARGWERIDTLSGGGGGGGGGATTLDGLLDVTITTPGTGDVLTYTGTGWVNASKLDPGTY